MKTANLYVIQGLLVSAKQMLLVFQSFILSLSITTADMHESSYVSITNAYSYYTGQSALACTPS